MSRLKEAEERKKRMEKEERWEREAAEKRAEENRFMGEVENAARRGAKAAIQASQPGYSYYPPY